MGADNVAGTQRILAASFSRVFLGSAQYRVARRGLRAADPRGLRGRSDARHAGRTRGRQAGRTAYPRASLRSAAAGRPSSPRCSIPPAILPPCTTWTRCCARSSAGPACCSAATWPTSRCTTHGAGDTYMRVTIGSVSAYFQHVRLGMGEGLGGLVAEQVAPYATASYFTDEQLLHTPAIDRAVREEGLVSILGVPLLLSKSVIGVLFAGDRRTPHVRCAGRVAAVLAGCARRDRDRRGQPAGRHPDCARRAEHGE